MNVTEYAKHRGVSQQAVSKALKKGVLTERSAERVGRRWQIDAKVADEEWSERVQGVKQRGEQAAESGSRARARLSVAKPDSERDAPPWA